MAQRLASTAASITVLGADCALEGNLAVRGELRVEGAVCGNVSTDGEMWVGPRAHIMGEVRAPRLHVAGRVEGIVYAREQLRVYKTGSVSGHVRYEVLEIERGGIVEGTATHSSELPSGTSLAFDDEEPEAAE